MNELIAQIYQQESRRVFSTLVRLLGSFDAAEEALHDAFVPAAEQWPAQGVLANPVAWLISTGRFARAPLLVAPIGRSRRIKYFSRCVESGPDHSTKE